MKAGRFLWKIVDAILFLGVSGMLVVVIVQVIGRLIGVSLPWSEEMTRNLFVLTVFLGMAVGFRYAEHARVTFLLKIFPEKLQKFQTALYLLSSVLFFGVVFVLGIGMTWRQFRNGEMSPATGIPMFFITLPISLCSILAIIGLVQSILFDETTKKIITGVEENSGGTI
jgi:TRAP-type C4-dicarboxylate transport system permease small subunit